MGAFDDLIPQKKETNKETNKAGFVGAFDDLVPSKEEAAKEEKIGRVSALGRGAYYGGFQQPRDVIAAGYANLFGGVPFKEGMEMAREMSLSGAQKLAQEQQPGYFTGGQVMGNIGASFLPAGVATKAIGAAAPALTHVPMAGKALSGLAKGVGTSRGIAGIPAAGAVQGAVATGVTEGDLSGALPGAIGAGALGALGKVVRPVAKGAISKARQGYTDILRQAGIEDLTPGQLTGGKNLETIDTVLAQMLPTAGAARRKSEGQLRKFTRAALKKAGIEADEITPEIREAAEASFSRRYGDLVKNIDVKLDEPLKKTILNIKKKQLDKLDINTKPIVKSYIKDINAAGKQISGEAYQVARSDLSRRANSMPDQYTAGVLRKLRNALDNAAERSLPVDRKGAWKQINKEYRNYKTLQKAASRLSSESLEGVLPPKALAQAVETANKTKGQAGYGELYNLSRAGRAVLGDSIPDSGTAQRLAAQQLLTLGTGAGTGLGTYLLTQDPALALGASLATLGGPKAAQVALGTGAARRYFTTGIPGTSSIASPTTRRLGALLAATGE